MNEQTDGLNKWKDEPVVLVHVCAAVNMEAGLGGKMVYGQVIPHQPDVCRGVCGYFVAAWYHLHII